MIIGSPDNVIGFLLRFGHLERPFGNQQDVPEVLSKLTPEQREHPTEILDAVRASRLTLEDHLVKEALRSHQELEAQYNLVSQAYHGRPIVADGEAGPATEFVMRLERCGHPDYAPPEDVAAAVGQGNWARCHNVGDFHAVSIQVQNSPPSFLAPLFDQVKERVTQAYAEIGLLIHWDGRGPVNIQFSFVSRSSGWIGLAIVSNNSTCNSGPIWCRYLSTYKGGNTDADIVTQWTTLVKHELGHNTGMSHSRGGVMNPSIVNGLPVSWEGDPSHRLLVSRFGGKPVPRGPGVDQRRLVIGYEYPDGRFEKVADLPQPGGGGWPT